MPKSKKKRSKTHRADYRDLYYKTVQGRITCMLGSAKTRAKKKNVEFNLEKEDIVIPPVCPLLGLEMSVEEMGLRSNSPSLDRKDPSKGYTKDNVWVISFRANLLKNNASVEELQMLVSNLKLCGFT